MNKPLFIRFMSRFQSFKFKQMYSNITISRNDRGLYKFTPGVCIYTSDWLFPKMKNPLTTTLLPRYFKTVARNLLTSSISSKLTVPFVHSPAPSAKSRRVLDSCAAPRSCCDTVPRWIRTLVSETRRERGTWERDESRTRIGILVGRVVITPTNFARNQLARVAAALWPDYTHAHTENASHGIVLSKLHAPLRFAAASAAVAFEWINRRKISKGFSHPSRPTAANTDPPHREN